jgi:DNA-binding CsgD family transcriptional regulator
VVAVRVPFVPHALAWLVRITAFRRSMANERVGEKEMTSSTREHCGHAISSPVTRRQQEIWTRIKAGMSNKEIARDLDLALGTVKVHVANLFRSLGVKNRAAAAAAEMSLMTEQRETFTASPILFAKSYAIRYEHDLAVVGGHLAARPY